VVSDDFPIPQDGILGSDFLWDASKIDFSERRVMWQGEAISFDDQETITIPARSRTTLALRISNPEAKEGYVPRIHVHENVFLGEAFVTNREGKVYIGIVNVGESDCKITVPVHSGTDDPKSWPKTKYGM
ncbi:hypothetical protein X777_16737, partial [Ooceraea biroi]